MRRLLGRLLLLRLLRGLGRVDLLRRGALLGEGLLVLPCLRWRTGGELWLYARQSRWRGGRCAEDPGGLCRRRLWRWPPSRRL